MSKTRIGVICGGQSVEHEISLRSAASIAQALDPSKYSVEILLIDLEGQWYRLGKKMPEDIARAKVPFNFPVSPKQGGKHNFDVLFPIVHGTGGEDGCLQGVIELSGIPYIGSGVLGSALQMDKDIAKNLLQSAGLPIVPWITLNSKSASHKLPGEIEFPCFVKPASLGSSVGTHKVIDETELRSALEDSFRFDEKVLIETAVDAREIEVSVIGNETPEASLPGEIIPRADFYDYDSKYLNKDTELLVPAPLEIAIVERLQDLAKQAFLTLQASGLARVDFFISKHDGSVWINELNSLPGFTDISMYPKLWEVSGLPYPKLLDRLVALALERHNRRALLMRSYPL